ncbi:MAG: hypothetical protein ACJ780_28390 [Solirubrobacteraceae bacterium]
MLTTDHTPSTNSLDFVLFPRDAEWDEVRQTFNLLHDQRPAAIALPRNEREV